MTDSSESGQRLVAIADAGPMIVATVALPGCPPDRALTAFTDPAVLARWWRGELTTELVPGGLYSVAFPAIPARLDGRVLGYEPASVLRFSWAWVGEDGHPARSVTVSAELAGNPDGTLLTIEHGPHADDEEGRTAHDAHWAGWEHFLQRGAGRGRAAGVARLPLLTGTGGSAAARRLRPVRGRNRSVA
jgi:uncharacterized protein YndB with AHSA1/START domain